MHPTKAARLKFAARTICPATNAVKRESRKQIVGSASLANLGEASSKFRFSTSKAVRQHQ
jgi:hypothetical protein